MDDREASTTDAARGPVRCAARAAAACLAAATLALAALPGCGEDTPEFEELTSPGEEEAVPLESEQLRKTPQERAESQAEAAKRLERREHQDLPGEQPPPEEPETAP